MRLEWNILEMANFFFQRATAEPKQHLIVVKVRLKLLRFFFKPAGLTVRAFISIYIRKP
jgi:hypothetical protein